MTESKKPRQTKTPAQRAQEILGRAQRRYDSLAKAVAHQRELLSTYEADLADAEARLDYARRDPALTTSTSTGPSTTSTHRGDNA